MKLALWEPFRDLPVFPGRLHRLFEEAFRGGALELGGRFSSHLWWPPVNVYETDEAVVLEAEVPGLDRGDIHLEVKNGTLTLKGERRKEADESTERFTRVERLHGSFQRSFALPSSVDPNAIEARLHNGVLEVTLPKVARAKSRTVSIETG